MAGLCPRSLAVAGFMVLCPEMVSFGRRRTPMPDTVPATENTCQVDAMRGLPPADPCSAAGWPTPWPLCAPSDPSAVSTRPRSSCSAAPAVAPWPCLAGALDDQLPAVVVGTFFSSFAASVEAVPHCICNAVPNLATWFEMAHRGHDRAPPVDHRGRTARPDLPVTATETAYGELVDVWHTVNAPSPDLVMTDAGISSSPTTRSRCCVSTSCPIADLALSARSGDDTRAVTQRTWLDRSPEGPPSPALPRSGGYSTRQSSRCG